MTSWKQLVRYFRPSNAPCRRFRWFHWDCITWTSILSSIEDLIRSSLCLATDSLGFAFDKFLQKSPSTPWKQITIKGRSIKAILRLKRSRLVRLNVLGVVGIRLSPVLVTFVVWVARFLSVFISTGLVSSMFTALFEPTNLDSSSF